MLEINKNILTSIKNLNTCIYVETSLICIWFLPWTFWTLVLLSCFRKWLDMITSSKGQRLETTADAEREMSRTPLSKYIHDSKYFNLRKKNNKVTILSSLNYRLFSCLVCNKKYIFSGNIIRHLSRYVSIANS